jgi:hypothetical protein
MTPEELFEQLEITLHNIRDFLAETAARNAENSAMHLRTEATLRRAIRLVVRDNLHERQCRRAAHQRQDELFDKIAAAQLVTEEMLQRFIQSRT